MTISIIDDHVVTGESLKVVLSLSHPDASVHYYNSTAAFLKDPDHTATDIIIIDLLMPNDSGLEFINTFRATFEKAKCIVVSALSDNHTIRYALRIGVDAYVSKTDSLTEITRAITSVMANQQYLSTSIRNSLIDSIIVNEKVVFHLTPREKEVLKFVCSGQTIKETAYHLKISVHTAQEHYKNIMRKFNVNRTSDLIVFAIKHGLYYI